MVIVTPKFRNPNKRRVLLDYLEEKTKELAQTTLDNLVSGNLKLMKLGHALKPSPDKEALISVVIMTGNKP